MIAIQRTASSSGANAFASPSSLLINMDGPRLQSQLSIKDRFYAPPSAHARSDLAVHSIPFVILSVYLLLWIVSTDVDRPLMKVTGIVLPTSKNGAMVHSNHAVVTNAEALIPLKINPLLNEKRKEHLSQIRGNRRLQNGH